MFSFDIPSSGLSLQTSQGNASKAGPSSRDAIGLTLSNEMLEDMIKCVQNGKGLQLSLGEYPSISYGNKVQQLQTSDDPFTYDIFKSTSTTNSESSSRSDMSSLPRPSIAKGIIQVPNKLNHSFFRQLTGQKLMPKAFSDAHARAHPAKTTTTATAKPAAKPSPTTGTDHALAQLQGALASEQQKKLANTTQIINGNLAAPRRGGPPPKMLTNKSKFLSSKNLASDTTRSMPSSPALSGVGSPSLGPTSVPLSQQQAEKDKEARKPVIHLLAVEPLSEKTVQKKLPDIAEQDLDNALRKVGDLNDTTGKWELRKGYWKELDVWAYKYSTNEDRQRAIDNAVKQYDKMRLGVSEPQWERLLIKAERGTGKSLSKLQADIAKGVARKNNSQNTDGSGRDTPNGDEDLLDDKNLSKAKGDGAARSSSQPPSSKPKKTSEKEAQAKRLFSKNPPKSANKPTPKDKPAPKDKSAPKDKPAPKAATAPVKKAAPASKAGTKVLSAEYVEDSDEDLERPVAVKEKPKPKPQAKPVMKRAREEDHDTSDSSIPLSKKVKKDVPATTANNRTTTTSNHRVSDASQTSRATTTTSSYSSFNSTKNKSNSPQKSSPLASSPPTNASDIEHSDRTSSSASPPRFSTKNTRSPIHKRHQKSSSVTSSSSSRSRIEPKAIELATKYRMYYPRYVQLFEEVTAEGDKRTKSKERDLLEMHSRLSKMRKEIESYMTEE